MVWVIIGILFLAALAVFKLVKGIIKFVLILVLIGIMIAVFAGKDDIEGMPAAPEAALGGIAASAMVS